MTIGIVQVAKLGDMVCTTPMFRAVKQHYPNARLVVIGNALNKKLLAGNPHIDEYVVHPETFKELRALLRSQHIEWLIFTTPNPIALLHALLVRIPHIVTPRIEGGFSPYVTKTYRLLSLFTTRVSMRFGHYMPGEYVRLLAPLGVNATDTRKELVYTPEARLRAAALLPPGPRYVGIAPGVGNDIKSWDVAHFITIAQALLKHLDITVVLFGGPPDKTETDRMAQELAGERRVINLAQHLTIDELKAAIARLTLFVSVDTGPIYIAEAFGVPTVDIVGPVDEREQPPQGPYHKVVVPPRHEAAVHILNVSMVDIAEARRQALATTASDVIPVVEALLAEVAKKG